MVGIFLLIIKQTTINTDLVLNLLDIITVAPSNLVILDLMVTYGVHLLVAYGILQIIIEHTTSFYIVISATYPPKLKTMDLA
jgi:hypothetical protein